jgi:hypothetical protein
MIRNYSFNTFPESKTPSFYRHKYHLSLSNSCFLKKALEAVNAIDAV